MAVQPMIGARLAMTIALAVGPATAMAQGFGTSPTPTTPTAPAPPPKSFNLPSPAPAPPPQDPGKQDAGKGKTHLVNDLQPAFDAIKAKDWAGAERFLLPRANNRDPRAQFLLGAEVYANRESKLFDLKKAVPLIKDSAERGFARSMLFYGITHADGAGVTKDMVEAYKWTALASRRGVPEAGQFLSAMAKDMTPDQIERAKAAADNFTPRR
ncbi:MAG: sel1 repeat family protein [Alphaproteobacteria bacterium]|nr:sel1 repeat family protein [Alphaproteobacteria bacterium]MCW5740883.1 sel1 repeat family protein [Alphaproteobacteria bacterium]